MDQLTAGPSSTLRLQTIALAGNPNSGKTTLFNALTGLRQKVANYPGVTVEKKSGRTTFADGHQAEVIDLPGTYSLIPNSPDEVVATQILRGQRPDTPIPDAIIAVVDASNLPRNLYLVSQLLELGLPLVVALNMTDIAARRGQAIDAATLEAELGVQVVPLVGHRRQGIDQLRQALQQARIPHAPAYPLSASCERALAPVASAMAEANAFATPADPLRLARRLLIGDHVGLEQLAAQPPVTQALTDAHEALEREQQDPVQLDIEARYRWIDRVVRVSLRATRARDDLTATERVDRILVHPVLGLGIFAGIMGMLFVSIFFLAQPVMDALQAFISWLGTLCTSGLAEGALRSLITDGIFNGVGTVVVFVPQIALLFLFLAVLEDSGYLARAAFLMDRLLSRIGLHGKSFIPLLSSFACAIPGVMASRTIDSPRDRFATILVAPFMSCSARLPVYNLLVGAFFSGFGHYNALVKGGIMLACYVLGVLAAVGTAWGCKVVLGRKATTPFILELPTYKLPQWDEVLRQMWTNTNKFLTKAGTVIFFLSVVLWALAYYPRLDESSAKAIRERIAIARPLTAQIPAGAQPSAAGSARPKAEAAERADNAVAAAQLGQSYAGQLGHLIEPVIAPLGFDWKIGVGLVASFAAREVFPSTMGIVYSVGKGDDDDVDKLPLRQAMLADRRPSGAPVWTPLVACSVLVWFVLAMQCMSTFAVVRRETGSWRWPIFQLLYMNALAYAGAFVTYHLGLAFLG